MFAQIEDNKIIGIFANPQPSISNVIEIADDDSRIAEFNQPSIKEQIIALEREITQRRIRDSILTDAGKIWLENKELEISALRIQL